MDGLLIDSEDKYTDVTNTILRENNRPPIPWHIKAQLQGRPGGSATAIFRAWAQLPISEEAFVKRQRELQQDMFKDCKPLAGVEELLKKLHGAGGTGLKMAVATSSHRTNFELKTAGMKGLFSVFKEENVVVGDDVRIPKGRGKPLPDIYLLALKTVNDGLPTGERKIVPEECLVFEDSVPGVEAGRRAGMRVVWCPHPGLLGEFKGREKEVLAGRTGSHDETQVRDHVGHGPLDGSPGSVGDIDDGWAELLSSLEDFDFERYGIKLAETRSRSESGQACNPGTTDKELEEMTAMADGKAHSTAEGTRFGSGHL